MVRPVTAKEELVGNDSSRNPQRRTRNTEPQTATNNNNSDGDGDGDGGAVERRLLRSKYLTFKNRIFDERDDITKVDSDKLQTILEEVDNLHQLVTKPREQVADAEALYDITNTLVSSVKAYSNEGVTPTDFINCLLRDFGQQGRASTSQNEATSSIRWNEIGQVVSLAFKTAPACCTMVGPMNTELKQRKNAVSRKRTRPTENARPEELDKDVDNERTDTDKNMATMFDILRGKRKVKLENLILNRNSFAQTVENLFALSFLVKDGRAEMKVDDNGCHHVIPKNAPSANAIASGEASYSHFIFRFDFRDWKLMLNSVGVGDELMPDRGEVDGLSDSQQDQASLPSTPIRKLCRNRGLVMQEQAVVEDSPEAGKTSADAAAAIRRGKRKIR